MKVTLRLEVLFQTFDFLVHFHIVSITRPVFHIENKKGKIGASYWKLIAFSKSHY
jgi:hypothetical protein